MTHLPDQEHCPGGIGGKMQLLGPDINITGQNIVHDDILDKGAPVMLLLIEGLGIVQGDIGQLAEGPGHLVITGAEHGVFKGIGIAHDGLEALLGEGHHTVGAGAHLHGGIGPVLPQQGDIGGGNDAAFRIHNAEGAVRDLLELNDHTLKNTVGHLSVTP